MRLYAIFRSSKSKIVIIIALNHDQFSNTLISWKVNIKDPWISSAAIAIIILADGKDFHVPFVL